MVKSTSDIEEFLKDRGYSSTRVRRQVYTLLENGQPRSINEIVSALSSFDRSSIYRTIAIFEDLGVIHRLQIGWKHKFELTDRFSLHHHHMSCTNCGKVVDIIDSTRIEASLISTARELGFEPQNHQVEIQGICPKCQTKRPRATMSQGL